MFLHVFAFKWKNEVSADQIGRMAEEIQAFQGVIPGLLETSVGLNTSPRSQGYAFGGLMRFTDEQGYIAYQEHPAHQALLSWLLPLIEPVELDFRV